MPDLFYLLSKWWKQMLFFVLLSLVIVGVIVFIKPRLYLSVATALPASSVLADKGSIFNENIEGLYSNIGSPDDLDRIIGTAQLDTVYLAVTDEFNLFDHYKFNKDTKQPRLKAARELKKLSEVMKSGYGELKVKVWDTDKNLAPQLANSIMYRLAAMYQNLQNENNYVSLNSLQNGKKKILTELDSISVITGKAGVTGNQTSVSNTRRTALEDQLAKYERLITEYQLMIDNKPAVLMEVEKAKPALRPDKPKRLLILIATLFFSAIFALFLAIVLEKKSEMR
jgi:hypothetical protein